MGRVFFNTRKNVQDVDGAHTMAAADSGKVFTLSSTAGACEITLLPAADLVEGWNCRFINTASPSGDKVIGAGSAIMHGATANTDASGGGAASDGTAKSSVTIEAASQAGNFVEIVCD